MAPKVRHLCAAAGLWFASIALAVACRAAPQSTLGSEGGTAGRRVGECSAGRTIDSAYVVRAAAEAIGGADGAPRLRPVTFERVVAPGPIEEGVLVRLAPQAAAQLGGGGLAFVEVESGCAVALKRYE